MKDKASKLIYLVGITSVKFLLYFRAVDICRNGI